METLATETNSNESRLADELSRLATYTATLTHSHAHDSLTQTRGFDSSKVSHSLPPNNENEIIMTILRGLVPSQNVADVRSSKSTVNNSRIDESNISSTRKDSDNNISSLHLLAHISKSLIDAKYKYVS